MRLLTSASGLKARSGAAWLLTLASLSLPIGLLTGCTEPAPKTSEKASGELSGRTGELAYVTDDELAKFVNGTPDNAVKFPEDNFVKGRENLLALKFSDSEKVLKDGLDAAVKSSAGQTKLGQYCIRLNNVLYEEKKYKEALKYGILASKIFYKQPPEQRPVPLWFFNAHMHMGFCYQYLGIYPEAETQLRKAINVAASAPAGQIDWKFHRLCYFELCDTLKRDHKPKEAKLAQEEMKALEDKHK
ncbi:MAG: tetratricopeptide repeat protein [Cyanobacteria bacterium REEB67]|nr:tetratricopeptide repeat protein [Cyanobacteria bacterium REEB67]